MSVIENIVEFTVNTSYDLIPEEVKELAHKSLIDYVAVTISGSTAKEAQVFDRYIKLHRGKPECRLIGKGHRVPAEDAALGNGVFAHVQDFDDAGLAGHPSAVLYSVAFAAGETNKKSGREMMRAYILGYEVTLKIADALMPKLATNGWHATSVFCTLGACVTAGILYNLSKEEFHNALGAAASRASGLMANFGTGTKPFHAGMAARNGIECALLAKCGITASRYAIEGQGGYAQTFARIELCADNICFGKDWTAYKQDPLIKKYPCCSAAHTALDAVSLLKRENNINVSRIKKVNVDVPEFTLRNLVYPLPKNVNEARFSMQFSLASMLLFDELSLNSYTSERLLDKEVLSLMSQVSMKEGEAFKDTPYLDNEPAVVTITLKDDIEYSKRIDFAGGTVQDPISEKDLLSKFQNCTSVLLSEKDTQALYELLKNVVNEPNLDRILEYL